MQDKYSSDQAIINYYDLVHLLIRHNSLCPLTVASDAVSPNSNHQNKCIWHNLDETMVQIYTESRYYKVTPIWATS